jgi:sodium-dependent dicarboxylate transporter 2/3/5
MAQGTDGGPGQAFHDWRLVPGTLGPACLLATLALPAPGGLAEPAWAAAGLAAWMAIWWVAEVVPLAVTGLLPLVVAPLAGIQSIDAAAAPFGNSLLFLFVGGFAVALAVQRCGLHRRLALGILRRVGDRPAGILAGFMAATAMLSMGVSNTATALMMVPMAATVVDLLEAERERDRFAPALLLGVAYAASLGGMATLVGTPPNAVLAAFAAQSLGQPVTFLDWMAVGLPVALVMTVLTWIALRMAFRLRDAPVAGAAARIAEAAAALGPWTAAERRVAAIAATTAALWIAGPLIAPRWPGWSDAGVAIGAAIALWLMPDGRGGRVLAAPDIARLPWDIVLLIGGGLSLAAAMESSGLAAWIGAGLGTLGHWPPWLVVGAIALVTVLFSELASNTATAAAFVPVVAALGTGLGLSPLALAVPVALAASCGFMLPVGTPPNAIAYATGRITIGQMVRAGLAIDLIGVVVVTSLGSALVRAVLTP